MGKNEGKTEAVKGFADLYEPDSSIFTALEDAARRIFGNYGYEELRIPIVEYTDLFSRSIGAETDVVQKEMFTMEDRRGRSLAMRPEATAGIMRSYIENKLYASKSVCKLFCYGPMFRYERPQKGRMRQFHQLDCECLGVHEPLLDAEIILMLMGFFKEIGLTDLALELNTLGCRECRPKYRETLLAFLEGLSTDDLCEDCRRRMQTNPLRVLDCKVAACKKATKSAPAIHEHVCPECADHFAAVRALLDGRKTPYILNPRLVRGLDYYMRTTFEVVSSSIGAQGSIAGGGRYDALVEQLGGPPTPGIGFACGMERLALALGQEKAKKAHRQTDFFVALLDDSGASKALYAAEVLRACGLKGEVAYAARSLKSLMRQASKLDARFCFLLGAEELAASNIVIKNMASGEQATIPLSGVKDWGAIQSSELERKKHR